MTLEQRIQDHYKLPNFKVSDLGIPEQCAYCGGSLDIYPESDAHIWCPNPDCSRKIYGNLLKFCDKLDLRSLGVVSLQALADSGVITHAPDLFKLDASTFKGAIDRAGDKAYENLQSEFVRLRQTPVKLTTLLAALNVPNCGEGSWEMILSAPCFANQADWDTLRHYMTSCSLTINGWVDLLSGVPRLSDRALKSAFYNRTYIADRMYEILGAGIQVKPIATGGPLAGKKFCQTGGLSRVNSATGKRMTRNDLIATIDTAGGSWSDTVDKLTYLIIDDINSTSSKAVKARKCGATLISEEDFFNLLEA
jgi:DNA ligase (NAD+)